MPDSNRVNIIYVGSVLNDGIGNYLVIGFGARRDRDGQARHRVPVGPRRAEVIRATSPVF
jgi:hypothetical protein